jgi:A/G-specific adenine glycosylase
MAMELIPKDNPALFNQAIMEFGALQCVPKSPNCSDCIFNQSCAALQKKKVDQLPVKLKKLKVRNRFFNYLIFSDDLANTIIQKRTDKGIWHNLYEFPLIETEKEENFDTVSEQIKTDYKNFDILTVGEENSKSIIHKLSHQHLHIKFWNVKISGAIPNGINFTDLKTYPFPIVLHNFIEAK